VASFVWNYSGKLFGAVMEINSLTQLGAASVEIAQGAIFPIVGVCLAVSLLFFIIQIVFSFTDFSLQFLLKLIIVCSVGAFMAKSFSEKYVDFSKAVFKSAAEMVR
jgi:flagellar biosynthesis protein FliQ